MSVRNGWVKGIDPIYIVDERDHRIHRSKLNSSKFRFTIFLILFFLIMMIGLLSSTASAEEDIQGLTECLSTNVPPYLSSIPPFYIATLAGTGEYGYNGDEMPAVLAQLSQPRRIAIDNEWNIYIGDAANSRVRYIDRSGIIHTFAGTGRWGYNGDGIPATEADLNGCRGVAVNPRENLVYISEGLGNRIRKVDRGGIISTYAGIGKQAESHLDPIYNGDEIPATEATLSYPYGITFDLQGNLYIADMSNHRIRMVDTDGIIHTVVGTGEPGYNGDGIPATQAQLNRPGGVAVDTYGNIYIADYYNHRVRKVTPEGIIHTIAGTGEPGFNGDGILATAAKLFRPMDVAVHKSGIVIIADSTNDRVRAVWRNGIITTVAGTGLQEYNGDYIPSKSANLYNPRGVAFDSCDNLYIADKFHHRLRFVRSNQIGTTSTR
jgi:hypothetical protein